MQKMFFVQFFAFFILYNIELHKKIGKYFVFTVKKLEKSLFCCYITPFDLNFQGESYKLQLFLTGDYCECFME